MRFLCSLLFSLLLSAVCLAADESGCKLDLDARFNQLKTVTKPAIRFYLQETGALKRGAGDEIRLVGRLAGVLDKIKAAGSVTAYRALMSAERSASVPPIRTTLDNAANAVESEFVEYLAKRTEKTPSAKVATTRTDLSQLGHSDISAYCTRTGAFNAGAGDRPTIVGALSDIVTAIQEQFAGNVAAYLESERQKFMADFDPMKVPVTMPEENALNRIKEQFLKDIQETDILAKK